MQIAACQLMRALHLGLERCLSLFSTEKSMKSRQYFVREPNMISVHYIKRKIDWVISKYDFWVISFVQLLGKIDNNFPAD